jgi:hypothetical protein
MQPTTGSGPLYALEEIPAKGKGIVAIKDIPEGTRILCEEPVITLPDGLPEYELLSRIHRQVAALDDYKLKVFLSMHNIHTYGNAAERYLGIFKTNALPIEVEDNDGGIFLEACRINHACDNNAQKSWNRNIKRHTVHALRDIKAGEEITIYYLAAHTGRKNRQMKLQMKFDFICSCRLCSLPSAESKQCDARLERILELGSIIDRHGVMGLFSSPKLMLGYAEEQVALYNAHTADDVGLTRVYMDAAQVAIFNSDLARGRVFVERAVSGWRIAEGEDSTNFIRHKELTKNPAKHELYGMSMKWKTKVEDVPVGLGASDFEDWLWKRKNPIPQGPVANL